MRLIKVTDGTLGVMYASCDDCDFDDLSKFNWKLNKRRHIIYAQAYIRINGRPTTIMMHRHIMSPSKLQLVDHVDGDGLNNQRSNLRICTHKQNCWNQGIAKNNTTGYRGVSKHGNGFIARIRFNDILINIKYSKDVKECAIAYNEAAIKYYGEFARLNAIK